MQTRVLSLIEAAANVLVGCLIAFLTQILVFPLYGIQVSHSENAQMVIIFTVVSLVRSYTIRRLFNRRYLINISTRADRSC